MHSFGAQEISSRDRLYLLVRDINKGLQSFYTCQKTIPLAVQWHQNDCRAINLIVTLRAASSLVLPRLITCRVGLGTHWSVNVCGNKMCSWFSLTFHIMQVSLMIDRMKTAGQKAPWSLSCSEINKQVPTARSPPHTAPLMYILHSPSMSKSTWLMQCVLTCLFIASWFVLCYLFGNCQFRQQLGINFWVRGIRKMILGNNSL